MKHTNVVKEKFRVQEEFYTLFSLYDSSEGKGFSNFFDLRRSIKLNCDNGTSPLGRRHVAEALFYGSIHSVKRKTSASVFHCYLPA